MTPPKKPRKPPYRMVAIDPGPEVLGYAIFHYRKRGHPEWTQVVETGVCPIGDFLHNYSLDIVMNRYHVVVYERFVLRPDLAQTQSGQDMLTSECIGMIRYPVVLTNRHAELHVSAKAGGFAMTCDLSPNCPPRTVKLVKQMADAQRPTRGVLQQRGIPLTAQRPDGLKHAQSAELHGWYYLLNLGEDS